jgi:hypothetical protein
MRELHELPSQRLRDFPGEALDPTVDQGGEPQ